LSREKITKISRCYQRCSSNELGCEELSSGCDLSMERSFTDSSIINKIPLRGISYLINNQKSNGGGMEVMEWWSYVRGFHGVLPREEVV